MRDDHIHLHGFLGEAEWQAFGHLITVSGIGPKVAQAILSGIPPAELWKAIRAGDAAPPHRHPRVWARKPPPAWWWSWRAACPRTSAAARPPGEPAAPQLDDAVSALMNLGYPEAKAKKAVERAVKQAEPGAPLEEIIKASLKAVVG